MTATYTPPADTRDANHFVTDFKVGLAEMRYTLSRYKDGIPPNTKTTDCPEAGQDTAPKDVACNETVALVDWLPLEHNDRIVYQVSATNGGYVDVENRDNFPTTVTTEKFYYNGQTRTRTFTFHWDIEFPYHCSETEATGTDFCPYPVEIIPADITSDPNVEFTFGGWRDDLSGLREYTFQVFEVKENGLTLKDGVSPATISDENINNVTGSFTLTEPGVYSIHLTAYDNTRNGENEGNYRAARTLLFFDDQSAVDINDAIPMTCAEASLNSSNKWVVKDTNTVTITWTNHFVNNRHVTNKWLAEIEPYSASTVYEEYDGNRTTAAIDNAQGIVEFHVGYMVFSPDLSDSQNLTAMSDLHDQSTTLDVLWSDGDKLILMVQATDLIGSSNNDTITLHRDATPPVIEDLWLTRGERLNVSVHRVIELTEMTIEWVAYDYHSGIDSLYWRIFDNFTGTDILHGHENVARQYSMDNGSCQATYGTYPWGANCYCTNFEGCFHRHFQVLPAVKVSEGLFMGMDVGIHDYDYYIEISVTNKAQLVTVSRKKITIDITPPHAGMVHDGMPGSPEIDYQQGTTLTAYWSQFFDRESGVLFYQYIAGNSCAAAVDFDLERMHPNVIETYETSGTFTAPGTGTYFFTVVAYNRALEASDPVCSDGVTIDTAVPTISEITIENVLVKGGLVTDGTNYWILSTDRTLRKIANHTSDCETKATTRTDLDLYPVQRHDDGTLVEVNGMIFCDNSTGAPSSSGLTMATTTVLSISWLVDTLPSKIYDFEVGLSSTAASPAPNLMSFTSTRQNKFIKIQHANIPDGTEFYIIIKAISGANVEGMVSVGPCYMDTTPPDFTGTISLTMSGDYLVAEWPTGTFSDSEEPYGLYYEFSVGETALGTQIQSFQPLSAGGSCTDITTPTCTAAGVMSLNWWFHGNHYYYISVKVRNTAGLVTIRSSTAYIHNVQLPSMGVVLDIDPAEYIASGPLALQDICDIDFHTDASRLVARWTGFAHPHLAVTYKISVGTTMGGDDVTSPTDVGTSTSFVITGLPLTAFQKYYFTVTAVTSVGTVSVSSDGVAIVTEYETLPGVEIFDGIPCNLSSQTFSHHEQDHRVPCETDIDAQSSTNTMNAYWTIPANIQWYTPDAYFKVEQRTQASFSTWTVFRDYEYINSTCFSVGTNRLSLNPGYKYRITLKLCARQTCFKPVSTDGVMVISNPPVTGSIEVNHVNGSSEKLTVKIDKFYDPDIPNINEKYAAVDRYEYAITDDSVIGNIYTNWTDIAVTSGEEMTFEVPLTGVMDFTKCKRFTVRGFNQVKMYATVSMEIKQCDAFNPKLIIPNIVIDAKGSSDSDESTGKAIVLVQNAFWTEPDVDYTPYSNIISAVWPTLRHRDYTYAILDGKSVDVTTYYKQTGSPSLTKPCSHTDKIRCGTTGNEYMNEIFTADELKHGTRYIVCVHADLKVIDRGTWMEELPAVSTCSDGVVVDLTPPMAGKVWISHSPDIRYQSSVSEMYVNWEAFIDVEEFGNGPNPTGIMDYTVGIGTSEGANDVVPWESVGVVNHKAFHGLNLQNGFVYYATVTATDFAGRTTTKTSNPIIVDYTAPAKTDKPIYLPGRHITSTKVVKACWTSVFEDLESGINYYDWYIGSQPGYYDIMSRTLVKNEECSQTPGLAALDLLDGHAYYISVEAFNNAGLSSVASSWAFVVDTTPPIGGHVYDGPRSTLMSFIKDRDYQSETTVLYAYWEGFHDPHSPIQEYFVSVGTCQSCDNVLGRQALGIAEDFQLTDIHLGSGMKYYVTVTACNTAVLCVSVSSDGIVIDNSPPKTGSVQDGTGHQDIQYQSLRSYIGAKWHSFTDPQSGIEKYVWRAGTTRGGDDVMSPKELHITEIASIPDLSPLLPVGKSIYITVRVYNRAGLWAEASSNGFKVDSTGPVITGPSFPESFGVSGLTQIYRTAMKVEWTANDTESHIQRQYLSIKSHIGGQFQLSSVEVNGIVRNYIFTNLDLHDGVRYYVTLIACNGAELCTTSVSEGMFVDTTPPSRGMFAVSTEHAANLTRHQEGHMTWSARALYLAWLGFSDIHSGIDHYKVTVGSSYFKDDLTDDTTTKYGHTTTGTDHGHEGHLQLNTVPTLNLILYDTVYVTVWAVNKVGLRSAMIHSAFNKKAGGSLELVRRCETFSCIGHCVCAPQDLKCAYSSGLVCNSVTSDNPNDLVSVDDVNGYSLIDQEITSSDTVLRGYWQFIMRQGIAPRWFEWSVGYAADDTPNGIYDSTGDRVWHDAGQLMSATYSSEYDFHLTDGQRYSFFVRLWYDGTTFADFKTNGIMISTGTLALATAAGKAVTEKVTGTSVRDADYVRQGRPMTFDWDGKFINADTLIKEFRIYISTFPGGYDVLILSDILSGTTTQYNMTRLSYEAGVTYYVNVVAYSYSGVHMTATSDGFIVDHVIPNAGIVYDGIGLEDLEYQNSTMFAGAHWHGFSDIESGIKEYYWCVGSTTNPTECGLKDWENVGLHTSASRYLTTGATQGTKMYHKVYAVDSVGLQSETAVSDGVVVDESGPARQYMVHLTTNLARNPSFETTQGSIINWQTLSTTTDICTYSQTFHHPAHWTAGSDTCLTAVTSTSNLANDGNFFLYLRGQLYQTLTNVEVGKLYRVRFYTSHLPVWEAYVANKEGYIKFGDEYHVFLIYTKSYRIDDHGVDSRDLTSWHRHTFYFTATSNNVLLTIGSVNIKTGLFFDNIQVHKVELATDSTSSGHVIGHIEYLHEWSSIHGSWSFIDPESPIIDYTWAIGYTKGGTQIHTFKSEGRRKFGLNNNVLLVHNTFIYITVIATNAAGLRTVAYSNPVMVDLTAPVFKFVYDGRGADQDAWETNEVSANWEVEDLESGIDFCQYAFGYKPGGSDLHPWTTTTLTSVAMVFDYSDLEGQIVYTSVKCQNKMGLSNTSSSDGVRISNQVPSVASAVLSPFYLSSNEYVAKDGYQSMTNSVRLKWQGFSDSMGIYNYLISLDGTNRRQEKVSFPAKQDVFFAHFYNLNLAQSFQDIHVQAINVLYKKSDKVTRNMTVLLTPPIRDDTKQVSVEWNDDQFDVSWTAVFISGHPLVYEVSAGTYQGGANIAHWLETTNENIQFGMPASITAPAGLDIYVLVRAVSVSGVFTDAQATIKFPT